MSKYRSKREGRYASKREARRAQELALLEKAGVITNLEEQVKYELVPPQPGFERAVTYTCDFRYRENGRMVVEDVKSVATKTPQYIIKRKLMLWRYGIKIRET